MVTYEITTTVEPGLVETYERYMREHHIPHVLGTGCFRSASFTRAGPGRYRVWYEAAGERDLERYLENHAPTLRADFESRLPKGVTVSREVWVTLQHWQADRAREPMSPERRIVGFHLDEEQQWVAELECGHTQHVRHTPPWQVRPWVLTEAGRSGRLGSLLPCGPCSGHQGDR
jgi:hypothetical protein